MTIPEDYQREDVLWRASCSQLSRFDSYIWYSLMTAGVICAIIYFFVMGDTVLSKPWSALLSLVALYPVLSMIWVYVSTRKIRYTLTNNRLLIHQGVFNLDTKPYELYRIVDYRLREPWELRLFGVSILILSVVSLTDGKVSKVALYANGYTGEDGFDLLEFIRYHVEQQRMRSRVASVELLE